MSYARREAVARYGAERVAVIIGTSTSGIAQAESAYRARDAAGRLPESFSYATTLNNFSAPTLVAHVRRRHRADTGDLDRVFVERQGVCGRRAPDARRLD